jgi:hypothetical protein
MRCADGAARRRANRAGVGDFISIHGPYERLIAVCTPPEWAHRPLPAFPAFKRKSRPRIDARLFNRSADCAGNHVAQTGSRPGLPSGAELPVQSQPGGDQNSAKDAQVNALSPLPSGVGANADITRTIKVFTIIAERQGFMLSGHAIAPAASQPPPPDGTPPEGPDDGRHTVSIV